MAMPQLDESKMRLVQELEIEMMTDMYSRQFYAQKVDMSSRQFLCTVDRYVQQVVLWTVDGHVQQVVLYEQNIEMYIRLIYVQQADLLVYIQHLSIECSSASREGGGGWSSGCYFKCRSRLSVSGGFSYPTPCVT